MKSKIALRLTLYFSASLVLFALILGGVFTVLFGRRTFSIYQKDLEKRASVIAEALSQYMSGTVIGGGNGGYGMGASGGRAGYGSYLRLLDDIAMSEVWVVDENLDLITGGRFTPTYADLPKDAESVVARVFEGETAFSESFETLLEAPTLTVGMPIRSGDAITGALLLHTPAEGLDDTVRQGLWILSVSIAGALLLSVLLSAVLAASFTRPLGRMKNTAVRLTEGEYGIKTGIDQKDEIGKLAASIDTLSDRLQSASTERERLDVLRREFMAGISHELRTPVTVIRGSLEALCDGVVIDPETVSEYHERMLGESIFLQRLVNDLLDLSRLQNADFHIELQPVWLGDALADAVRSARQLALAKQIEIRFVQTGEGRMIRGDYGRLRQMFLTVLDNAVKYSPDGSPVDVSLDCGVVIVRDRGPGIAKQDLPQIFDRFFRGDVCSDHSGTGLGLAIAKQIADRHEIVISVRSNPGEGAEFIFRVNQPEMPQDREHA